MGMREATPTRAPVPSCPRCGGTPVVRNGHGRTGAPNYLCRVCCRQCVERPKKGPIPEATKELIRRLLLERVALRAIARATGVSRAWLQRFVNELYREQTPFEPGPVKKTAGELILEADERWSFVGSKTNPWWVWVAFDLDTRRVVAMVLGDRSEATAKCLWEALPEAYLAAVPPERHAAGDKGDGITCHVERFWWTCRRRCARVVRKTLSFSKCLLNHVGALWYFVRHYNESLP
jgi:insertion element IS1 protein InsB